MIDTDTLDGLRAPFPLDQIYSRQGPGGKSLDYVAIETVLQRLLDAAPDYSWHATVGFTPEGQPFVQGQLTIDGKTASGFGADSEGEKSLDKAIKTANSEAMKNAAKNGFGVALDLWNADYRDAVKSARRRAGLTEAQLKAQVFKIAIAKLGKEKPSAAEIGKLFGVPAGKLTDKDTLLQILAAEDA
jgi:hypothetical protein